MNSALETVQAWYDAIDRRDWPAQRALVDPAIQFVIPYGYPQGGHYIGAESVFDEFLPNSLAAWRKIRPEMDEIFAVDRDRVVVRGRYVGRTRETDTPFDVPFAHLWRASDGRLTWLQMYVDTAVLRDAIVGRPTAPVRAVDELNQGAKLR